MRVLLLGSTGMVGSEVLRECMLEPRIAAITVLNRRKALDKKVLGTKGSGVKKVTELSHDDFRDFSRVKKQLAGHDICFYCVGVYQGEVPEAQFIEITHDYTLALAKTIASPKTVFCLFSAQFANPDSSVLFARWKGRAERDVAALTFKRFYAFRPGYIQPSPTAAVRKKRYAGFFDVFFPIFDKLFPWYCITSQQLARAMVTVGLDGSDKTILENIDARRVAK